MVVPTDTTVVLKITASDVIHSWWIPKLGGKADAVPGYMNETWFKVPADRRAPTAASAPSCAAPNHADMRAVVRGRDAGRVPGLGRRRKRDEIKAAGEALGEAAQGSARGGSGRVMEAGTATRRADRAPGVVLHGLAPAAARLAALAHHHRSQADRDHVPVRHLPVLHPGRRRGADHAPPARAAEQHAGRRPRPTTGSSRCTARRWSSCSSCRCWPASATTSCRS